MNLNRCWAVVLFAFVLVQVPVSDHLFGQDSEIDPSEEVTASDSEDSPNSNGESTADDPPEDPEAVVENAVGNVESKASEAVGALKSGDLKAAADKSGELFVDYGVPAITALVSLIVAYFIAAFLARLVSNPLRKRVDETLGRFIGKLIFYVIMVSAVLGILQYFGFGIASFAAVIAAAGFAVGLAFQGTLSNFAAGIMLLVFRPFVVGDVVSAAGITAKVNEIGLFTTTFDTPDNRRFIVPNSAISGGTIENISHHDERRVDVSVGVDYAADLQKTRDVLTAAADSVNELLLEGDGRGYAIVLGDLGDSAVGWTVKFWTKSEDYWTAKEQLTAAIKSHLDIAGIGIPFPQMDVHVHQN